MDKFSKLTRWIAESFAVTLFAIVLISQCLNILFRYTKILPPLMWVEEFTRFSFIWILFLLWHLADREDAHFKVDFAVARLTGKPKACLVLFQHLIVLGFATLTIWSSIRYIPATMAYGTNSFNELPMGVVYMVIPLGLVLVAVEHIRHLVRQLLKRT